MYQQKREPDFLHLMGIAVQAYADTWAHKDFSALFKFEKGNKMNDANHVKVWNKTDQCFVPYEPGETTFDQVCGRMQRLKNYLLNKFELMKMGHCQVYTLPDEPHRKWKYYHRYSYQHLERDNVGIYLEASNAIYGQLQDLFSRQGLRHHITKPIIDWKDIKEPLHECFSYEGTLEKRNNNWIKAIETGEFGFTILNRPLDSLEYDRKEWFDAAVEIEPKKSRLFDKKRFNCFLLYGRPYHPSLKATYSRKDGFLSSDWKLFHDAARKYKDFFIHKLLQKYGMICG